MSQFDLSSTIIIIVILFINVINIPAGLHGEQLRKNNIDKWDFRNDGNNMYLA